MYRPTTILFALALMIAFSTLPNKPASAMPAVTIRGYAWIDENCDSIRQDGEASATMLRPYVISYGPDGVPFTSDDAQLGIAYIYTSGPNIGQYEFDRGVTGDTYRLSILQEQRPAGYAPTKYRQGNNPTRWSSLQANWATTGFQLDENNTVDGGNIGIMPTSCLPNQLYLPLIQR
jgi:hypothetical protein